MSDEQESDYCEAFQQLLQIDIESYEKREQYYQMYHKNEKLTSIWGNEYPIERVKMCY